METIFIGTSCEKGKPELNLVFEILGQKVHDDSSYESYDEPDEVGKTQHRTSLNKRLDIQQLVVDINSELRNLILKHREIFYSNWQFSHCSVQVSLFNDRVRGIKYHMIHVVFHIHQKEHPQELYQWWISCYNPQTIAVGKGP